jgi:hypothetical protein
VPEGNWLFWHNVPSLTSEKETIIWKQEKNIYKHWLLPKGDLYNKFPDVILFDKV